MKKSLLIFFTLFIVSSLSAVVCDAQIDLTKGLFAYYPMSGNAKNALGSGGGDCTVNGATLTSDRFGNASSAYNFDGNSYLEGTLNTTGFTGMTVSAWIKTNLTTRKEVVLYAAGNAFYISLFNPGRFTAAMDGTGGNNSPSDETNSNVATDAWVFITATNDGTTTRTYVNGVNEKSYSETLQLSNGKIQIGGAGNTSLAFVGSIDEVHVYNRQLSDAEVGALYQLGCPNDITNGLYAFYPMNGNAKNVLGSGGGDCTVNGATLTTDRSGNANSAYAFDGNSYLEGTLNTTGFSGLTVSAWIKTSLTTRKEVALYAAGNVFYISLFDAGKFTAVMDGTGGNNASTDESISSVTTGSWIFLTASNDGTTTRVYVNGTLEKSYAETLQVSSGKIQIGGAGNPVLAFVGSIDEVRVYNRMLCDNEVTTLYTKTITGIDSHNDIPQQFSVYPEPSKGLLNISTTHFTGNSTARIYDLNGKLIYSGLIDAAQKEINISGQKPGIYILNIKTADQVYTRKIVLE
jgi:hypothetical protein